MSRISPGLPLDASGVLAWRLLEFMASKRPSAREELGNKRLDEARNLAIENKYLISPRDLEIAKEKFTLTTEIKSGLGSKKGLSKFLQAREFCKSAKDTLRFVETVSGRAKDDMLGQWAPGFNPVLMGMDTTGSGVDPRRYAEMKPNVATLVETLYHFSTSQAPDSLRSNRERSQMLLRNMNFVYPEPRDGGKRHRPYRHSILQRAINVTWFRTRDDVGVVNHEHFSPMPVSIIAITLTVVECCIDEWSSGMRQDSSWDDEKFQAVYTSHVSSLFDFKAHSPTSNDVLNQLQCDLLKDAREHAGVPPHPITEQGRFPPGALDVVRQGRNQLPSPDSDLPPYDDLPEIVVETV
ncbi:hypothetical protein BC826DRAFT_1104596 [Russula brevipes]|nr:hypothetical protein BC826DRAFT_1104596 [Russula brevipes]